MVKRTQTNCWLLPMNCLSVVDHCMSFPFEELRQNYLLTLGYNKNKHM